MKLLNMQRGACAVWGVSARWCRRRSSGFRVWCRAPRGCAHALLPETLERRSGPARPMPWPEVPPVGELSYRLVAGVWAEQLLGPVVEHLPELAVASDRAARHVGLPLPLSCGASSQSIGFGRLRFRRGGVGRPGPERRRHLAVRGGTPEEYSRPGGWVPIAATGPTVDLGGQPVELAWSGRCVGRTTCGSDELGGERPGVEAGGGGAGPPVRQSFVDSNCASSGISAALMVEAQMRLPFSLRCRPSSMKMSSMTVPSAWRNGVATSM